MRKFLFLMGFSALFLIGFPTETNACTNFVGIAGPSGRCEVAPGTPITYTGSHDFWATSPECVYYEWTVEGGTITGLGGQTVEDGQTLCISGDQGICSSCFTRAQTDPNVVDAVDFAIITSTGTVDGASTITVTWNDGVEGKLKLKVKRGSAELETETSVDLSIPAVTSVGTESLNGGTSTRFTANLDNTACPGQNVTVEWFINGSPAGTGMQRIFNVGPCSPTTADICVRTSGVIQVVPGPPFTTTVTTPLTCLSFTGTPALSASIIGPTSVTPSTALAYNLVSNQVITNATWTTSLTPGATFVGGNTGSSVFIEFANEDDYTVFVTASTQCVSNFTRSISVNVDNDNDNGGGIILRTQGGTNGDVLSQTNVEPSAAKGKTGSSSNGGNAMLLQDQLQLRPSLVEVGQDIDVLIPLDKDGSRLMIMDVHGNQIRNMMVNDDVFTFSTSGLSSGVYIVTVQSKQGQESRRFVVQ